MTDPQISCFVPIARAEFSLHPLQVLVSRTKVKHNALRKIHPVSADIPFNGTGRT